MDSFSKARFLAYGKWDYTVNKSLYRNAAIVILVLFTGTTLLTFLCNQSFATIGIESKVFNTYQFIGWLHNIAQWSVAIMSGYLFHNMVAKNTRIMELTLPATIKEKFWWHVAVNIGGTLAVCIVGYIVSDIIQMLLSLIFNGADSVSTIIPAIFTTNVSSYMREFGLSMKFENEVSYGPDYGIALAEAFADCMQKLLYVAWVLQIITIAFYSGLFSYVNSRKYRHNIPLTIVILIGLGVVILVLVVIAIVIMSVYFSTHTSDFEASLASIEFATDLLTRIFTWMYVAFAVEVILSVVLWAGTYRNYKKASLLNK
ncbi:MAG: hypothetical protein MJY59_00215 [Bacteroidaceae bacterium]|nr:hypothetical protein [Bacteroidaceae bacterium]